MSAFRICAVIPTYDNPATLGTVVRAVRKEIAEVIVVNDGSAEPGRRAVEALEETGIARALHRPKNGGKGAAVKDGLALAWSLGYTHALQIDADGQHDLGDIPRFVRAASDRPDALVLGAPVFDASVPKARLWARKITTFWSAIEAGGRVIADPMCGFRIYPLAATVSARAHGDHMEFDPEIAVRLVWSGAPVVNLQTKVRYLRADEGGVSHFRMWEDNLRISWMHTKMVFLAVFRWLGRAFGGVGP